MTSYKAITILTGAFLFTLLLPVAAQAGTLGGIFPAGLKPSLPLMLLFMFLGVLLPIAVHELGHLLTGLALGFRFQLFVIFLLGIKRTDKGVRPYLNTNMGYMGGIAATTPQRVDGNNQKKFAWIVLAGPLASLLLCGLCYILLTGNPNIFYTLYLITGIGSFGIFLATTIPNKTGVFFTDRARFQRLINKGKKGKAEAALLNLLAITTAEGSYKNVSLTDARTLQEDEEGFMRFWGWYYTYEHWKELGSEEQLNLAEQGLRAERKSVPDSFWKAVGMKD